MPRMASVIAERFSDIPSKPAALKPYFSDPGSALAARNLGIAWAQIAENYSDARLFDKAWPLLREAAAKGARDPALYAKVGEALEAASKSAEAEKAYRLALDQDPRQVEVLLRLAALLDRSGKRAEASALRERSRVILPRQ